MLLAMKKLSWQAYRENNVVFYVGRAFAAAAAAAAYAAATILKPALKMGSTKGQTQLDNTGLHCIYLCR